MATHHIPVVMVTALSDQSDRVRGLDAGADDFLTKERFAFRHKSNVKPLESLSHETYILRCNKNRGSFRPHSKPGRAHTTRTRK